MVDLPFWCCWETYYRTDYTSSNIQFLSTLEDIVENTPKSVIGHSYCQLKYDGDAGRVYSYLLDQNSCYDSVLSCLDGVLTIYNESSNCEGDHLEQYRVRILDMFSICTCTLSTIFLASYRAWKKLKRDESGIRYLDIFTELRKTMPLSLGLSVFSIFNFLFFIIIYCIAYFSSIAGNDIDQYIIAAYPV